MVMEALFNLIQFHYPVYLTLATSSCIKCNPTGSGLKAGRNVASKSTTTFFFVHSAFLISHAIRQQLSEEKQQHGGQSRGNYNKINDKSNQRYFNMERAASSPWAVRILRNCNMQLETGCQCVVFIKRNPIILVKIPGTGQRTG